MDVETRIDVLLAKMTLAEKVGQMHLSSGHPPELKDLVRRGLVGAVGNLIEPDTPDPVAVANELQAVAVEQSRAGIPLLFGRDVIHGYRTVFPIPLAQAASFDTSLVEEAAAVGGRGGLRLRNAVDFCADGGHFPRPALGAHRGKRRRGPAG